MPRNVLLAETQNIQWPTGLARPDESDIPSRVFSICFAGQAKRGPTSFVSAHSKVGLIEYIVREKFEDAYAALGKLTGRGIPDGVCPRCGAAGVVEGIPGGKSLPRRELP